MIDLLRSGVQIYFSERSNQCDDEELKTLLLGSKNDQIQEESCAVSSDDENDSNISFHRKFYPQRPNRTKLNYRDLERGMFEQIRQNEWNSSVKESLTQIQQKLVEPTRCAMRHCENLVKIGSAYCSKVCVRGHVNEQIKIDPKRNLFRFRDVRTKKIFEKNFSTKTNELFQWLIDHRSHVLLVEKNSNAEKTSEIRSKVRKALAKKLTLRASESMEFLVENDEILTIVNEIEEEMFRLYKKIDNSYKNKFRSLLTNISNTKNDFFYRQILSRRWIAEEIVSMKAEDMLPPDVRTEEKEEHQDEIVPTIDVVEQTETPSVFSTVDIDVDNDYIEPESPTGVDALIYDDDDENSSSSTNSPIESPRNSSKFVETTNLTVEWRGIISSSESILHCQSANVYGENRNLFEKLPEQLNVVGRLRLIDLWHYVRDSILVRDILILTIVPSVLSNVKNEENFRQYFFSLRNARRAAVMTKQIDSAMIRDLYILPAETTDCPTSVSLTFGLPKIFDSSRFFLIVIGSTNSFVYKPIALQNVSIHRDPRLMKSQNSTTNDDELQKLIDETFVQIRQATSIESMQPMISSLLQTFKDRQRDDLTSKFTENLRTVVAEWKTKNEPISGDNFTEENMDVDVEEEKDEKCLTSIVLPATTPTRRDRKRKSRFSDIVPNCQVSTTDFRLLTSTFNNHKFQSIQNTSSSFLPSNIFDKNQWLDPPVPRVPLRTEATLNLLVQQQKRYSSCHTSYSTHYHDFDRPEE